MEDSEELLREKISKVTFTVDYHVLPVTPDNVSGVPFARTLQGHPRRPGELKNDVIIPLLLALIIFGRSQRIHCDQSPLFKLMFPPSARVTFGLTPIMRDHVIDVPSAGWKYFERESFNWNSWGPGWKLLGNLDRFRRCLQAFLEVGHVEKMYSYFGSDIGFNRVRK